MARKRKAHGTWVELGAFSAAGIAERRARAYVPSGAEGERPVLVMLDGQNVFGDEGSFAGGWHAHEAVEKLAKKHAPVIVAVDHGGAERIAEMGAPASPKLAAFVELVVDRVLPAAHARLALRYGPSAHYVAGSSMGGLAALYMHFRRPEVFGGAIAMSPSLFFQRRGIFDFIANEPNPYRSRVYLDAGANEAGGRLATLTESMANALRARGWSGGAVKGNRSDLRVIASLDPRGAHRESSWRRRLPNALRFVFAP